MLKTFYILTNLFSNPLYNHTYVETELVAYWLLIKWAYFELVGCGNKIKPASVMNYDAEICLFIPN